MDPDLHSKFGSGSRRAKATHKIRKSKEISCFEMLEASHVPSLGVLFGGIGISNLQFLIKK
jgi:hypothetical protein